MAKTSTTMKDDSVSCSTKGKEKANDKEVSSNKKNPISLEIPPLSIPVKEYKELQSQVAELSVEEGQEELMECCRYGDVEPVRALLQHFGNETIESNSNSVLFGPNQTLPNDQQDTQQNTPLHMACANGHDNVVRLCLQNGLKESLKRNSSGNTALHWAAANGHVTIVKLLLDHCPNVDVLEKNDFGRSALTEGFASQSTETAKVLLEHDSASEEKLLSTASQKTKQDTTSNNVAGKPEKHTETTTTESPTTTLHHFSFRGTSFEEEENDDDSKLTAVSLKIREVVMASSGDDPLGGADASQDATGLGIWGASLVMAQWMVHLVKKQEQSFINDGNVSILELGAGCGVPGLALVQALATLSKESNDDSTDNQTSLDIYLTDLNPKTVDNLQHNVQLNPVTNAASSSFTNTSVKAMAMDWLNTSTWPKTRTNSPQDDNDESTSTIATMDVILGCDLIYDTAIVPSLIHVLETCLRPGGSFFYVSPSTGRKGASNFVERLLSKENKWSCLYQQEAPPSYCQSPLTDEEMFFLHFNEMTHQTFTLYHFRKE